MADKLDVVVVVTGDGDFAPLITYLQENKGCLVEVIAFGKTTSSKLRELADDFCDLDGNPRYLMSQGKEKMHFFKKSTLKRK